MQSRLAKTTAIGKGLTFHASPRQAFLRRQKLIQHESSCTNIHNKANTYAYGIAFYPSDARNEIFDRESSPTLRKLNCSAFLLIKSRPLVNKEHVLSLAILYFGGTNIETYFNSLSATVETLLPYNRTRSHI